MIVAFEDLNLAVERARDIINENKNDNASILFRFDREASKMLVAYADGTKAVCSKIDMQVEETDSTEAEIVAPFKFVSEAMDVVRPTGIIYVDEVRITIDPSKQNINFEAEKYIKEVADEDSTEEVAQVISVMNRSFAYKRMEEDKRQRILNCVNYEDLLASSSDKEVDPDADVTDTTEADTWGRGDLINTLQKMTVEDAEIIFSGKTKNVRVTYAGFAVCVQKDEIGHPLCINTKTAKTLMAVLKHCTGDEVDVEVAKESAVVRSADGTVALWFTTIKPKERTLKTLNGYCDNTYDKHQLVMIRDAIVNQIKCLGDDANNVELSFEGSAVDGYKMNVGGGVSSTKTNKFSIALSGVSGENEELLGRTFSVNTEAIKSMLNLCEGTFIGIEIDLSQKDGSNSAWLMRVCEISKNAGMIERGVQCFTVITMIAKN